MKFSFKKNIHKYLRVDRKTYKREVKQEMLINEKDFCKYKNKINTS